MALRVKEEMKIIELFRITGFTDTEVQMTHTDSNNLITGTMSSETETSIIPWIIEIGIKNGL